MKRLDEIVRDEIEAFYPEKPKIVNGTFNINIPNLVEDIARRKVLVANRLHEDPALEMLAHMAAHLVHAAVNTPGGMKVENYEQIITEATMIWENANRKFNDQLGYKPPLLEA